MASVAPADAMGPCPKYRAFLQDICDRLAKSPNQRATLSSLQKLVSKHPSAQIALGGVRGLAVDFPECVRVSGKDAVLVARPNTVPDLVSDQDLHLRRYALRLLFAYHGNRAKTLVPNVVVAAIVAQHAATFGGLEGLAKIVQAYPQFVALRADGGLSLVAVPPSCLKPLPLSDLGFTALAAASAPLAIKHSVAGASLPGLRASLPNYGECLRATCAFLQKRPGHQATLAQLQPLSAQFAAVTRELGGFRFLAVEFPRHLMYQRDAFTLLSADVSKLASDALTQRRRHALRLVFAYHKNQFGINIALSVVDEILAHHRLETAGIESAAALVHAYPEYLRMDANTKMGYIVTAPAKATLYAPRAFGSWANDERPAGSSSDPAVNESACSPTHSILAPIAAEPTLAHSSPVTNGTVLPDLTAPLTPESPSSAAPPTWKPFHKHARCDIFVVKTGVTATRVQAHFAAGAATMLALDIEGNLTRGASASIDVIQLATMDADRGKPAVFVWDFARATPHDHMAMVKALRALLEDARHIFVVHDGRADADVLAHLFGITLSRTRTLDTQVLFKEWVDLSIAVRSALSDEMAVEHCAPPTLDPTRRAGLNVVLAACGLPINEHKKTMAAAFKQLDGGAHVMYWHLHADATLLLEYAAFDVDQLAQAADVLLKRIRALTTVRSLLKSGQHVHDGRVEPDRADSGFAERGRVAGGGDAESDGYVTADEDGARGAGAEWRASLLPKSKPVKARFVANGRQLEWRDVLTAHGQLPADDPLDADSDTVDSEDQDPTEMDLLLDRLPWHIRAELEAMPEILGLIDELVLDLGRVPQLFIFGANALTIDLDQCGLVTREDLAKVCDSLQFTSDNRAGLEGCLHRISRLLNRNEQVVGVTIRVGRASAWEQGVAQLLLDLLYSGERSILILGRPGSGKTYTLRDLCARLGKQGTRVLIVDTSNEIGGDGDIPHASLGKCRRMQVRHRNQQHAHLIEAVQNHTPDVIVMDEIGTRPEVTAARTVAPRVRAMLATAHGTFRDLIKNPDVRQLLGGIENATVGDAMASAANGFRKTRAERAGAPVFDTVVELLERGVVRVYHDVAQTVDDMLEPGRDVWAERRWLPGAPRGEGGEELPECRMEKGAFWAMLEQA
ncbi:hypothetical protein GGF32_009613 [Allomyces javanicus]|nr:hypothetical protein GGF32_009613 [Allomyces javanicus]